MALSVPLRGPRHQSRVAQLIVRPLSSHVSILRTQSVIRSPRQLDAVLVVGVTLLCIAAPLVATNAAIAAASGIVVLAVLAWFKRCPAAAPLSIFCVICLSLRFSGVRYGPVILAFGLIG